MGLLVRVVDQDDAPLRPRAVDLLQDGLCLRRAGGQEMDKLGLTTRIGDEEKDVPQAPQQK